jgi:hypothetical protein
MSARTNTSIGRVTFESVDEQPAGENISSVVSAVFLHHRFTPTHTVTVFVADFLRMHALSAGGRISLNATLFDTQSFAPTVGPVLVSMCSHLAGGEAIVTSMTSSQSEAAALMGSHFGGCTDGGNAQWPIFPPPSMKGTYT